MRFFEDDMIFMEFENSEIAWVKIFVKGNFKELSDLPSSVRQRLFEVALATELALKEFYNPDKINWASFANYLPRVHLHIQARFKDDSFFPESMWGKVQRDGVKRDLRLDEFARFLSQKLS